MRDKTLTKTSALLALGILVSGILLLASSTSAQEIEPVTVHTIVRTESDIAFKNIHDALGFNVFLHRRAPVAIDQQDVIRMNRDTIYSSALLDLSQPAFINMPETDGRYMNLQIISQDHYSYAVTQSGRHEINQDKVGTRYAGLVIRTFIDADDPEDIAKANALQDQVKIEGGGEGPFEIPNWNIEQMLVARDALNTLGKLGISTSRALGMEDEVDPIDHLVLAASGWGGLPEKYAFYVLATMADSDGTPHTLTVKDVPVDAFWSVTVYGADGFIHENDLGVYSFNNITAKPNEDGSFTINFGDCGDGSNNCLPISEGWNYAIRMYEPRAEILDGSWVFPTIESVK
jgi:hypothetical protein